MLQVVISSLILEELCFYASPIIVEKQNVLIS